VGKLVNDFSRIGFAPDWGAGNNFNAGVETAVRAFQSSHVGPDLIPLVVDGKVGASLDVALGELPPLEIPNQPLPNISARLADASLSGWNAVQIAKQEFADRQEKQLATIAARISTDIAP